MKRTLLMILVAFIVATFGYELYQTATWRGRVAAEESRQLVENVQNEISVKSLLQEYLALAESGGGPHASAESVEQNKEHLVLSIGARAPHLLALDPNTARIVGLKQDPKVILRRIEREERLHPAATSSR